MASERRRKRLVEGMRTGDLKDLVLPLVSVDEYESKVDDDAVVFGFYVEDEDAANDFNRFVQKSPVSVLDTEVSPAPDQHGYFLCFIEMLDNKRLGRNVEAILKEIGPLVGIDEWQMRVRKSDKVVDFSPDDLVRLLARARHGEDAEVLEFLTPSALDSATLNEGTLEICGASGCHSFAVEALARLDDVIAHTALRETSMDLSMQAVAACNRLQATLGSGWTASLLGGHTLLQREGSPRCLLLSPEKPG